MSVADERKEIFELLKEFLKKATGDNASSAEIAIIPDVAKVLLSYKVADFEGNTQKQSKVDVSYQKISEAVAKSMHDTFQEAGLSH